MTNELQTVPQSSPQSAGPQANGHYTYTNIKDAPILHRQIATFLASLYAAGIHFVDHQVAEKVGCNPTTVARVRNHPPIDQHIQTCLKMQVFADLDLSTRRRQLAEGAMDVMEKIMLDTEASPTVRVKAAQDFLDREPTGNFAKTTKSERIEEVRIYDTAALAKLAKDGMNLGLVGRGEALPVNATIQDAREAVDAEQVNEQADRHTEIWKQRFSNRADELKDEDDQ